MMVYNLREEAKRQLADFGAHVRKLKDSAIVKILAGYHEGKGMTFDQVLQKEAESLFDAKAALEIRHNMKWEPLLNQRMIDDIYQDRENCSRLASSSGVSLSNGDSVRFKI